jgi:predicted GIY-YIG superfamily endonuclease
MTHKPRYKPRFWYVYAHSNAGKIFYIGSGLKSRPYDKKLRNALWKAHVSKTGPYTITRLAETDNRKEALRIERDMIAAHKPACNTIAEPTPCSQCKQIFTKQRAWARFCCEECRVEYHKQVRIEGRKVLESK